MCVRNGKPTVRDLGHGLTVLWIALPAGLLHDREWSPPITNYISLSPYLLDNLAPGTAEKKI